MKIIWNLSFISFVLIQFKRMSSILNKVKNNLLIIRNNFRNERSMNEGLRSNHKVNNLEKKFLVWTGKYKTIDEVPTFVQQNVVERARNRMRIKIANYMMATTALACLVMVYLGKQDAKKGKSVSQQNLEWHRQVKEETTQSNAKN